MGNELKNKIFEYNGITTEEAHKKKPSIANYPDIKIFISKKSLLY
jgi:hypothetical protein